MTQAQKYRHCMVMAGGGFRYGIYLGLYAAACEVGRKPDVVLATCGASIAAALIHRVPDDAARRAWLASPEMYRFWSSFQPAPAARLHRTLWRVARRALQPAPAPTVPDLFDDYLFAPPAALPAFPTGAHGAGAGGPDIALVGSRLLFSRDAVGQRRGQRKLLEETVFCTPRTAALLHGVPSPFADVRWGNTAVAPTVATDTAMPLGDAVRISVSDMFYFPAYAHGGAHYMGGVVDLFPIELAHRLAQDVSIEFKSEFEQLTSAPAWRAVLGINANQRLRHVHGQQASVWVDTSDLEHALPTQKLNKQLDWRNNRISLLPPASHAEFAQHMQDQWDYGYQRGLEAFGRTPGGVQPRMRNTNRYNRGAGMKVMLMLKRLLRRKPPSAEQRARALIQAIDAGGLPLNAAIVNDIARQLGLEVSGRARVEDTIARIRAAVGRM